MPPPKIRITITADSAKASRDIERLARSTMQSFQNIEKSGKSTSAKVNKAWENLGLRPTREIRREIQKVEASYKRLARSGKLSLGDLMRAKQQAKARTKELDAELKGLHKTGGLFGGAKWAPIAAITALASATTAAIRTYVKFDDVMRQVGAVTNATAEETRMLRDAAKEAGATTRFSASQAAEGLRFLGMAGFSAEQATKALPGVLQLAAAGAVDLGQAADITTNVLTGYGMTVGDIGRINDVLVKTFTSSNSSLEELGFAFSYVGPIAKSAGLEFEETAAILGKLHDAGIKGERAGTALRGAISRLLSPVRGTSDAIEELGLEIYDSTGKIRPLTDILAELQEKGASAGQVIKLFGVEAGPGMAALLSQGTRSITELRDALHGAEGEAARVSEGMEAGLGGSMREFASAVESLVIEIVEGLDPMLQGFLEKITSLIRAVARMEQETKAWATALKPVGDLLDWMGTGIQALVFAIGEYGARVAHFTHQIEGFFNWIASGFKGGLSALKELKAEADRIYYETVTELAADISGIEISTQALDNTANAQERLNQRVKEFEATARQAYSQAIDQAEAYGKKVEEWERKIEELRLSSADKIRALRQKAMSDNDAWADRQRQAEEKLSAARQALNEKDYKQAESLAQQAERLYASLAAEVKGGRGAESVVVKTLEETVDVAAQGVEQTSRLIEEVYSVQKEAAQNAKEGFEETAEKIKAKLDELAEAREAEIRITAPMLDEMEAALNSLARDRTMTIHVRKVEENSTGGRVGLARGGKIPGWGGGDTVRALLERGEFVIRKEAVKRYGAGLFEALNRMTLKIPPISLPSIPRLEPAFATGGLVGAEAAFRTSAS